jgi:hypothetical protein
MKRPASILVRLAFILFVVILAFVIFFAASSVSSRIEVGVAAALIFSVTIFLWKGRGHAARVGLTAGAVLATIAVLAYTVWMNQPTPLPADKQAFVGVWNAGSQFRLEIRRDGTARITQKRGAAVFNDLGIRVAPDVVETANVTFQEGSMLVSRPTYYARLYRIDRAPQGKDAGHEMVLNGVTLVRE